MPASDMRARVCSFWLRIESELMTTFLYLFRYHFLSIFLKQTKGLQIDLCLHFYFMFSSSFLTTHAKIFCTGPIFSRYTITIVRSSYVRYHWMGIQCSLNYVFTVHVLSPLL